MAARSGLAAAAARQRLVWRDRSAHRARAIVAGVADGSNDRDRRRVCAIGSAVFCALGPAGAASAQHRAGPATIPPWPSFPDPLLDKPTVQSRSRDRWNVAAWTWDDWTPIVSRYLGEIALLDDQIGRLLAALDRLDLAANTLVIYTTDHGDMCGGHGMMDKHYVMYDDIMRVPLLLRWPGVLPAAHTSDAFVIHALDLARTILEVAGIDPPPSFVGRNLIDIVTGTGDERSDVFGQYQGTHQGLFSQRMLRDRRWKYIYNPAAEDELYDLAADPGELRNLAVDPAHAEQLHQMRERMGAWMAEINDPLSPPLFSWRPGSA
jgi:arylsulfatase A-like enzyme